jgi:hypothetical protein
MQTAGQSSDAGHHADAVRFVRGFPRNDEQDGPRQTALAVNVADDSRTRKFDSQSDSLEDGFRRMHRTRTDEHIREIVNSVRVCPRFRHC